MAGLRQREPEVQGGEKLRCKRGKLRHRGKLRPGEGETEAGPWGEARLGTEAPTRPYTPWR